MEFNTYKNEDGLFVALSEFGYSGRVCLRPDAILINDKVPEKTHHKAWFFLRGESEICCVKKLKQGTPTNYRWALKDDAEIPEGLVLKQELSCDEVGEYVDEDDYGRYWSSTTKYYPVRFYYNRVYDISPDTWEDVEFEVDHLGDVTKGDAKDIKDISYNVYRTRRTHEGVKPISIKDVATYSELDQMMHSDFTLHNRPCSISPEISYKIIRRYVIENLDRTQCDITSDYDFCFTVKKRICIRPFLHKKELLKKNGKSYAKPKFSSKIVEHKSVEIFEIAPKPYQSYTVAKGFKGDCLEDLIENVKLYLEELIDVLNTPIKECECCSGTGYIIEKVNNSN